MLEVDVHQRLHAFLRQQGDWLWPHQLTVARLVARAFRLQRSALIQVSPAAKFQGYYRYSYLMPLLLCPGPVVVVASSIVQQDILHAALPELCGWSGVYKPVCQLSQWPGREFTGILMVSPGEWLGLSLGPEPSPLLGMMTVVDGVDDLEAWTRDGLRVSIEGQDWEQLQWCFPEFGQRLRDCRVQLTHLLFQHSRNPYDCVLMGAPERGVLGMIRSMVGDEFRGAGGWQRFLQRFGESDQLLWAEIQRQQGTFVMHCAPMEVRSQLQRVWEEQPVILLGGVVDEEPTAPLFRQRVGLGELTCVQFGADRAAEQIQLYLPDGLPMPNTPQFQGRLVEQVHGLVEASWVTSEPIVIIIDGVPLKAQVAAILAAKFGSNVQVEVEPPVPVQILVTGWEFWLQVQHQYPSPPLLVIGTLPIPSLEDPRVAGRVAYLKKRRQDWFREFLLPEALRRLQCAIAPVRAHRGVVALLDNRVLHRSYGKQVLAAISPYARLTYIDTHLFGESPPMAVMGRE